MSSFYLTNILFKIFILNEARNEDFLIKTFYNSVPLVLDGYILREISTPGRLPSQEHCTNSKFYLFDSAYTIQRSPENSEIENGFWTQVKLFAL